MKHLPKRLSISIFVVILILLSGCDSVEDKPDEENEPDPPAADYVVGQNRFTIDFENDEREYYVHVPTNYDSTTATPVVFMLHGTSGDGLKFYNISGWKELAETENILTVYPSSWRHCVIKDGVTKNTTKWNVYPGEFTYCDGEVPRNDIGFFRQIITELNDRFNIDATQTYLAGFSNGGSMAFRAGVEMSDVFAAVVQASGSISKDSTYIPKNKIPLIYQLGNSDDNWRGDEPDFPMSKFDSLLQTSSYFQDLINTHASTFDFETDYTVSGDTNSMLTAKFRGIEHANQRNLYISLIKGLDHQYPNGTNHPMKGAEAHWNWFQQYRLP